MEIKLRMKTGFFETKPYALRIENEQLLFIPAEAGNGHEIALSEKDVISVTLKEKPLALEVATMDSVLSGMLTTENDISQMKDYIKARLSTKIICEFEGRTG